MPDGEGSGPSENLVFLFTDIVESTRMSSSMAPEAADDVRRRHFSVLRQAVQEEGGLEVKNLGDGLMVVFNAASRALACAAAMQQGIDRLNRGLAWPIGLRIGVSGGEVVTDDGDYFGDPVVEAARLCARCEGGEILAADVVRIMAGRRSRHECRPVGALELKGLPGQVETVAVMWDPLEEEGAGSIPLPPSLEAPRHTQVVGREAELATIAAALQTVAGGNDPFFVFISGEAGQGKTALVAEAARRARSSVCVLFGHCEEDLTLPYQLFAEPLEHVVTHVTNEFLAELVSDHAPELARLVPKIRAALGDLSPSKATGTDSERYLLRRAVAAFLSALSQRQPVILVLDDLQWADPGSLQLLHHIAATEQPMRVLVLGTYRDAELTQSGDLLQTVAHLRRRDVPIARIELPGLDDTGVVSLMEAIAGHTLDEEALQLAGAVRTETDGNPFFVGEVLRHLSETGAIYQQSSGRWAAGSGLDLGHLPDSVREVVSARVLRLGESGERALSLAAVIGRDFDVELLARALPMPEDALLDLMDAARSAALVREDSARTGWYRFTHALVQHTVYENLGPTRCARFHRVVAEALEELCGGEPVSRVSELARHWLEASPTGDRGKAIAYAKQAGDAALAALAPDDALRYYTRALDLLGSVPEPDAVVGLDLRIGLGTAQRQAGHAGFRETLLDAAHRAATLGDTERLVAAALENDRGNFSTVDQHDQEKVDVLELALARIPEDHGDRAVLLATLCSELTIGSTLERRQALADEALRIADSASDDEVLVRVINHVLIPLAIPPLLEQSLRWSTQALERAEQIGDPLLLRSAASGRRLIAGYQGDLAEWDRCYELSRPLVEQIDQPFLVWVNTLQRSTRELIAGDVDRAEQLASEALQIGTEGGQPDALVIFGAQMIMISWCRGTLGNLVPLIEQAIVENPGLAVFTAALALAHADGGRPASACEILGQFGQAGYELPMDVVWLTSMVAYANAAVDCRDLEAAASLFEHLAPFADQWHYSDLLSAGPISLTLGGLATVVGHYEEADAQFAAARSSSERAGAHYFSTRADIYWGAMLSERDGPGDLVRARTLLARGREVAVARGYASLRQRADHLLG